MLPLPQVRVYYSSLNKPHSQLIHILEHNRIPFELIDAFVEMVDSSLLEKDTDGNILFPQIFKFDHDRRRWVFAATLDSIVEWNEAGVLHARLATKPHPVAQLEAASDALTGTNRELQARLDDHMKSEKTLFLEKRRSDAELSALRSQVVALAKAITQQDDEIKTYDRIVESSRETILIHERAKRELLAKHSALETQHRQQVTQFETAMVVLTGTNRLLQERLSDLEKRRFETELSALRTAVSELTRTIAQIPEARLTHERVQLGLSERTQAAAPECDACESWRLQTEGDDPGRLGVQARSGAGVPLARCALPPFPTMPVDVHRQTLDAYDSWLLQTESDERDRLGV